MLIDIACGSIGFVLTLSMMIFIMKIRWNKDTFMSILAGSVSTFAFVILFFGGIAQIQKG